MKSLLFVDDEPRVLQGLQRQLRTMRQEWSMTFVESGRRALEFMASAPVDVIVSDMLMPAMDGAELLTEVMNHYPSTVRLVLSGHTDREAVFRLVGPAHQCLSKPCNPEELRAAITRAFAVRELLSSGPLIQLVSRIPCLPSLPALYLQVTKELRQADPSLDRIADLISRDIGMTAKILQLVNSAFFGLAQPVGNVADAVAFLGIATMTALVLASQVFSRFEQKTIGQFSLDALEQHSWMAGVLARRIAEVERCDSRVAEQCFLGGLLHDIGHLILAASVPALYGRVLQAALELGQPLWEAEQGQFGATHAELGAYLLGLWGLPSSIIEAVAFHHRPSACPIREFSCVTAVHVADAITNDRDLISGGRVLLMDRDYLASLGLEERARAWRQLWADRDVAMLPH